MFNRREIENFNFSLVLICIFIISIGIISLYSATNPKGYTTLFNNTILKKHILWITLGFAAGIVTIKFPYRRLVTLSLPFYIISVILLFLVLFISQPRLGAQRWLSIGALNIQPSELAKFTLILELARVLSRQSPDRLRSSDFRHLGLRLLQICILVLVPMILIFKQPDLGTALTLVPIVMSMLFVAGIKMKYLLLLLLSGLASLPLFWNFILKDYQRQRLLVFVNPNIDPLGAGYTVIQSKIAIGSGRLFGKGWLAGTQNYLNFLPERHTDFIFSILGEEWGFIGAMTLILLYWLLIRTALNIVSVTSDEFGRYVAVGIVTMFAFQILVNISMTIGMVPVVGLPLPFMSYGGSSMVTSIVSVALLLNIAMRRPVF
jgi:rod shape determining protein RodA